MTKAEEFLAFGDKCARRGTMQTGFMSPELKLLDAGAPTLQTRTGRVAYNRIVRPRSIAGGIMLIPSGEPNQ